jgi:hypothetical protein
MMSTPDTVKPLVRERDGFRCVECGLSNDEHRAQTGRQLDVHRLVPGSEYTVAGCVTLCRACHGPKPRVPWGQGKGPTSLRPLAGMRAVLERLAREQRRSLSQTIELLLEEVLQQRGLYTPPQPEGGDA